MKTSEYVTAIIIVLVIAALAIYNIDLRDRRIMELTTRADSLQQRANEMSSHHLITPDYIVIYDGISEPDTIWFNHK